MFKNLLQKSFWIDLTATLKETSKRFPLAVASSFILFLLALQEIHDFDLIEGKTLGKLVLLLCCAMPWFTSLRLYVENRGISVLRHLGAAAFGFAVLAGIIFYSPEAGIQLMFIVPAIVLMLLYAPYLWRRSTESSVWYFNYILGNAVFFGWLSAVLLGAGSAVILLSIGYLFELDIPEELYADIWVFCWAVVAPIYVLANIEKQFDFEEEECDFPKGVLFIKAYVLVPLAIIYTAILYAYFAKIAIQWELPKGQLGWMITAFGTIGMAIHLTIYPLQEKGAFILRWFYRWYYHLLLLPIVLLGIAIWTRVEQYGVTEKRYTVMMLGVWFAIVSLLYVLRRDRFHIKYVPMVLSVLALLASFGPWGAIETSTRSQVSRLEVVLIDNGILKDGRIVQPDIQPSFKDRQNISSIVDYIGRRSKFSEIEPWFAGMEYDREKLTDDKCYGCGREIMELMGVDYVYPKSSRQQETFNYSAPFEMQNNLVDVSGYEYASRVYAYSKWKRDLYLDGKKDAAHKVHLDFKDGLLTITFPTSEILTFNALERAKALYGEGKSKNIADEDMGRMIFDSTVGAYKVRLLVGTMNGQVNNGDLKMNRLEGVLLISD